MSCEEVLNQLTAVYLRYKTVTVVESGAGRGLSSRATGVIQLLLSDWSNQDDN